jgi:hypothetical protein
VSDVGPGANRDAREQRRRPNGQELEAAEANAIQALCLEDFNRAHPGQRSASDVAITDEPGWIADGAV